MAGGGLRHQGRVVVFAVGVLCGGLFVTFLSGSNDKAELLPKANHDASSSGTTATTSTNVLPTRRAAPLQSVSRFECVSMNEEVPRLLNESGQTFVTASAKTGGTSLKSFAPACMNTTFVSGQLTRPEVKVPFLIERLKPPKLVAAHILNSNVFLNYMDYAASNSLLVYSYRPETDRLASAISYAVKLRLCQEWVQGSQAKKNLPKLNVQRSRDACYLNEIPLIEHFIKTGFAEIAQSGPMVLTCDMWAKVDEMEPNFMVVDYRQLGPLQEQMSNTFCPHTQPRYSNKARERGKYYIRTQNDGDVELSEWIDAKKNMFEYWLQMPHWGCKGETRRLDEAIRKCPDGIVRVKGLKPYMM